MPKLRGCPHRAASYCVYIYRNKNLSLSLDMILKLKEEEKWTHHTEK